MIRKSHRRTRLADWLLSNGVRALLALVGRILGVAVMVNVRNNNGQARLAHARLAHARA